MTDIMNRDRVVKRPFEGMEQVQDYLLCTEPLLDPPPLNEPFRQILTQQKDLFLNITQFNKEQYEYAGRCCMYMGDWCAKKRLVDTAAVVWRKIRESGLLPREKAVSTYMYILAGHDLLEDVAIFHDLLYEPNEKTITLRIKALIDQNKPAEAENILFQLPDKKGETPEWKRLRTFLPILTYYCRQDDAMSLLRLWRAARQSDGVFLDADTYALLFSTLARLGSFDADATGGGPALFDHLASECAQDLLELTPAAARQIYNALTGTSSEDDESLLVQTLPSGVLTGKVTVDKATGVCPATQTKLRLFMLTHEQREQVHDTLLDMAAVQHEEYGERRRAKGQVSEERDGAYALEQLSRFSRWLRERQGPPFTVVIDGPNVAYYGHGDVHYSQVQAVHQALVEMGEYPLVVMPLKYASPTFWLNGLQRTQDMSEEDAQVLKKLQDEDQIYLVPAHCLDDYYWMLSSVVQQTFVEMKVSRSNTEGRFPGLRPMLITNDQMRDHRLNLLAPRLFRRWSSCHIVNYDIKPYTETEWEKRNVEFCPVDFFSREIQGNQGAFGSSWHFPVSGWSDFFCVAFKDDSN